MRDFGTLINKVVSEEPLFYRLTTLFCMHYLWVWELTMNIFSLLRKKSLRTQYGYGSSYPVGYRAKYGFDWTGSHAENLFSC